MVAGNGIGEPDPSRRGTGGRRLRRHLFLQLRREGPVLDPGRGPAVSARWLESSAMGRRSRESCHFTSPRRGARSPVSVDPNPIHAGATLVRDPARGLARRPVRRHGPHAARPARRHPASRRYHEVRRIDGGRGDARLPPGIYFYRVEAAEGAQSGRVNGAAMTPLGGDRCPCASELSLWPSRSRLLEAPRREAQTPDLANFYFVPEAEPGRDPDRREAAQQFFHACPNNHEDRVFRTTCGSRSC